MLERGGGVERERERGAEDGCECVVVNNNTHTHTAEQQQQQQQLTAERRRVARDGANVGQRDGVDGVQRALPALLFALPFYFLMGLAPGAAQFLTFAFIFVAFNAAVGALALGLAAALGSPGKTVLVMNLVLLVGVLFAGFLANKESIPPVLRWLTWLSVFRYAWEAMVINELTGAYLYLTAPNVSITIAIKGEVFLQIIGVDAGMIWTDVAVLAAMYLAACAFVLGVLWLRYGRHDSRRHRAGV